MCILEGNENVGSCFLLNVLPGPAAHGQWSTLKKIRTHAWVFFLFYSQLSQRAPLHLPTTTTIQSSFFSKREKQSNGQVSSLS